MTAQKDQAANGTGHELEIRSLRLRVGGRLLVETGGQRFGGGRVHLILGPSGVGKSVLLKTLAGLLPATDSGPSAEGEVFLDGARLSPHRPHRDVGLVFQTLALLDEFTPRTNVAFAIDHSPYRCVTDDATCDAWLERLGVPTGQPTRTLSGGQRQRLAVARALAARPRLLLFDEPTSGLDPGNAAKVAGLLQETARGHGCIVLVVTHDMLLASVAETIHYLDPARREMIGVEDRSPDALEALFSSDHPAPIPTEDTSSAGPPGSDADPPGSDAEEAGEATAASDSPGREGSAGVDSRDPGAPRVVGRLAHLLEGTGRVLEETARVPIDLLPLWRRPAWGLRYLAWYLWMNIGPTALIYMAIGGAITGFVTTYFTLRFLPYSQYTEPLLLDSLLASIGFALFRVLVPVLATILIAARSGAAIASDVGTRVYNEQWDALRSLGASPRGYWATSVLLSMSAAGPALVLVAYGAAMLASLAAFLAIRPFWGADFWQLHVHAFLWEQGSNWPKGTGWLIAKSVAASLGVGAIAFHLGARRKSSPKEVAGGITGTILWASVYVLLVHLAFAFAEFDKPGAGA